MRLRPEQLPGQLRRGLKPLYVVSGDEPLQWGEAMDAIRAAAREAGFGERVLLHAGASFDWDSLRGQLDSLSLFAERRVIDLRLPAASPGNDGARVLTRYAERPSEDVLLLIGCGRLDGRSTRSKWFGALERAGAVVQVRPVEPAELPGWIARRMAAAGGRITPEAAAALAERVEGNLLACEQEIRKLRILHPEATIEVEHVHGAVADSARYDVFGLVEGALEGDARRTLRILHGLCAEGVKPQNVLGTLAWCLRSLAALARETHAGTPPEQLLGRREWQAWRRRQRAVRAALQRHGPAAWQALILTAGGVDRTIKGSPGDAWDELQRLALGICGVKIFPGSAYNAGEAAPHGARTE